MHPGGANLRVTAFRPGVPGAVLESGRPPAFFMRFMEETVSALQPEIEARLAGVEPEVEVLLAEVSGPTLRLFIDHPDGVSLELCERVSGHLKVSSPGQDRPLTKPQHYSRFLGRRARVRLRDADNGHKQLTGELVGASDSDVTIAAGDGVLTIPYEQIVRSNLVPGD